MKRLKEKFSVKLFCGNCFKEVVLTFEKGTDLEEKGYGEDKSIKVEFPSGKWGIAECPRCGSMKLNKRF